MSIHITAGSMSDYAALARLHYRAGPPATSDRILRAQHGEALAGVLIVSRPVLNARWRSVLWPGVFEQGDARQRAARINRELRCISRVIVDSRFRGLGMATMLVRAYLDDPLTLRTEAVAAMGRFSGFFRSAGMREIMLPSSRRDVALRRVLRRARLRPWQLVDPASVLSLRTPQRAMVHAALRRWASDAGATRRLAGADVELLIAAAARSVASPLPAVAYGFDSRHQ